MKIDKSKPAHWLALSLFGFNVVLAIFLRLFVLRRGRARVILYGHKLNGNLSAIYRVLRTDRRSFDVHFLTMDRKYHRELRRRGQLSLLATSPACIAALASADAVVSDHGLHVLELMLGRTSIKFFDVWHGIPFKGFDAEDFRVQHRYDEIWVASPMLARLYVERYGFDAAKVKVTGYARTDRLVRRDEDTLAIKRRLGLNGADVGKIVLFAPTWKQDAGGRSIYPFGLSENAFFEELSAFAQRTESTFVMRTHLNSGSRAGGEWLRIEHRPHALYPDTEELLLISDILVCDWSSIAFDYLLLRRPSIFLDVVAPFAKGFSIGPEHRFGPVVPSMDDLLRSIGHYLRRPHDYQLAFGEKAEQVRHVIYNEGASGRAAENCVAQLRLSVVRVSS